MRFNVSLTGQHYVWLLCAHRDHETTRMQHRAVMLSLERYFDVHTRAVIEPASMEGSNDQQRLSDALHTVIGSSGQIGAAGLSF